MGAEAQSWNQQWADRFKNEVTEKKTIEKPRALIERENEMARGASKFVTIVQVVSDNKDTADMLESEFVSLATSRGIERSDVSSRVTIIK